MQLKTNKLTPNPQPSTNSNDGFQFFPNCKNVIMLLRRVIPETSSPSPNMNPTEKLIIFSFIIYLACASGCIAVLWMTAMMAGRSMPTAKQIIAEIRCWQCRIIGLQLEILAVGVDDNGPKVQQNPNVATPNPKARNTPTATNDRKLSRAIPHSPCPLVHPLLSLVPNPTSSPPTANPKQEVYPEISSAGPNGVYCFYYVWQPNIMKNSPPLAIRPPNILSFAEIQPALRQTVLLFREAIWQRMPLIPVTRPLSTQCREVAIPSMMPPIAARYRGLDSVSTMFLLNFIFLTLYSFVIKINTKKMRVRVVVIAVIIIYNIIILCYMCA